MSNFKWKDKHLRHSILDVRVSILIRIDKRGIEQANMNNIILLTEQQQSAVLEGLANITALFWGPNPEICRALLNGSFFSFFNVLQDIDGQLSVLKAGTNELLNEYADEQILFGELERQYVLLFISNKDGVIAPLYHSCHISENAQLMGPPAMMMKKKLRAVGLNAADNIKEPPDHIAIEGEYLYFLLEKSWRENDKITLNEAKNFAGEEMLPWVKVFRQKLGKEQDGKFYGLLAEAFSSLLRIIS